MSINYSHPIAGNDLTTTTLTISRIEEAEFGQYTCRVANNLGQIEETIDVSGKYMFRFYSVARVGGLGVNYEIRPMAIGARGRSIREGVE